MVDFHLFADDTNLFFSHKNLQIMESIINHKLCNINTWPCSNKVLLNIEKTNFVIFKPHQKKINYSMELTINDKSIKHVRSVKYLGIMLDCHLNWKDHFASICKKLSRGTGVLCKVRHYVTTKILIQLYYSTIYPFLIFGCTVWGMIYNRNIQPLFLLQKKIICIMTFSKYDAHTNPIFYEIIKFYIATFMYQYIQGMLPRYSSRIVGFKIYFSSSKLLVFYITEHANLPIYSTDKFTHRRYFANSAVCCRFLRFSPSNFAFMIRKMPLFLLSVIRRVSLMALNEFRCFGDFEIFDVVEVLFWRIIASTLGHVTCLLEI